MTEIFKHIFLLARGGGGGSSSGGGGGGGGSILVVGYVLGHLAGEFSRRKGKGILGWLAIGAGQIGLIILCFVWPDVWPIIWAFTYPIGAAAGRFGWFDGLTKRMKANKQKLDEAALTDTKFDPTTLVPSMQALFIRFQTDWQNFNTDVMKAYTTPRYWEHLRLQMAALYGIGRQNKLSDVQIFTCGIVDLDNAADPTKDRVDVEFQAQIHDQLIRKTDQKVLNTDDSVFNEVWHLQADAKGRWLLDGIRQATESAASLRVDIAAFAETNNLYYSPDWGRLLLPERGALFGGASFHTSDINNHCIGLYHNVLIQLYTYQLNPEKVQYDKLVAQVTVPKFYGHIVIQQKKQGLLNIELFNKNLRGLNKLSTEWNDFNSRYDLYADNQEQVTSFELLQPKYMEQLYALPFPINIEVVDNIIYLYSDKSNGNYKTMLDVLKKAFDELKM